MPLPVYLDYNGTTPHAPEVIEAMRPFLETEFGNPSSSHWYGTRPRQAVETARQQVAGLIDCSAGNGYKINSVRRIIDRFDYKLLFLPDGLYFPSMYE